MECGVRCRVRRHLPSEVASGEEPKRAGHRSRAVRCALRGHLLFGHAGVSQLGSLWTDPEARARRRGRLHQHGDRDQLSGCLQCFPPGEGFPGPSRERQGAAGRGHQPVRRIDPGATDRTGSATDRSAHPLSPPRPERDRCSGVRESRHDRNGRDGGQRSVHPFRGQAIGDASVEIGDRVCAYGTAVPAGAHTWERPAGVREPRHDDQGSEAGCHDRLQTARTHSCSDQRSERRQGTRSSLSEPNAEGGGPCRPA